MSHTTQELGGDSFAPLRALKGRGTSMFRIGKKKNAAQMLMGHVTCFRCRCSQSQCCSYDAVASPVLESSFSLINEPVNTYRSYLLYFTAARR